MLLSISSLSECEELAVSVLMIGGSCWVRKDGLPIASGVECRTTMAGGVDGTAAPGISGGSSRAAVEGGSGEDGAPKGSCAGSRGAAGCTRMTGMLGAPRGGSAGYRGTAGCAGATGMLGVPIRGTTTPGEIFRSEKKEVMVVANASIGLSF